MNPQPAGSQKQACDDPVARLSRSVPALRRGALFMRWIQTHPTCGRCGLVYLRNQGDLWLYWMLMDRVPILLGIASIFFGLRVTGWISGLVFFLAIAGPLVATMPQRMGISIALNYLSRRHLWDPSDELPAPSPTTASQSDVSA